MSSFWWKPQQHQNNDELTQVFQTVVVCGIWLPSTPILKTPNLKVVLKAYHSQDFMKPNLTLALIQNGKLLLDYFDISFCSFLTVLSANSWLVWALSRLKQRWWKVWSFLEKFSIHFCQNQLLINSLRHLAHATQSWQNRISKLNRVRRSLQISTLTNRLFS